LLENEADPMVLDKEGRTPLHYLFYCNLSEYSSSEEKLMEAVLECMRRTDGQIASIQDDQGGNLLTEAMSCSLSPNIVKGMI
jgi:hypothetical protein